MKTTQKEFDYAIGDLVDRILERGRQSQVEAEGTYTIKDGGLSFRRVGFIQEIKDLAATDVAIMQTSEGQIIMKRADR